MNKIQKKNPKIIKIIKINYKINNESFNINKKNNIVWMKQ